MNKASKTRLCGGASAWVIARALGAPMAVGLQSAALAGGLPSGGHYVAGNGIIDWTNFSIGAKKSVTFDNGSGATLNRVTGGNLSKIAGSLNATGTLYLI